MGAARAALAGGVVRFEGGRIDALVVSRAGVLRTADADRVEVGIAQVRRRAEAGPLELLHVVFAPARPRPLLLGLVRLWNRDDRPLVVDYTEVWEVAGRDYVAATGAAQCRAEGGVRALADAAVGVRGRPAPPPPDGDTVAGLALDVRLPIAPGARRELAFAYVAPADDEDPGALARAWRGDVALELDRTVASWIERFPAASEPVDAYRRAAAALPLLSREDER